jgi:hypothetical protein
MWNQDTASDLRATDNGRCKSGDTVGMGIAVQLQEVRLHRIRRVDRDAIREDVGERPVSPGDPDQRRCQRMQQEQGQIDELNGSRSVVAHDSR